ncbi:MAG: serine protein kinase RIO [Thermoplasmata archaeon]|jgi:RIO kinase 1
MFSEKEDINYDEAFNFVRDRIKFERIENDYDKLKVENDVFDRKTVMNIYYLMTHDYIDLIDFPIKIGKEANIFRAKKGRRYYALKIYRISTSTFNSMIKYMEGDYRFQSIKRNKLGLIYVWTQKEFRNLTECYNNGVIVPKPIIFKGNTLLMQYLGTSKTISPILKDYRGENLYEIYEQIKNNIFNMVNKAHLVHGDLSEYNIVIDKNKAYFIDVSQALPINHPLAIELLNKDIKNIVKFFNRKGLKIDENDIKNNIQWGIFK